MSGLAFFAPVKKFLAAPKHLGKLRTPVANYYSTMAYSTIFAAESMFLI